MAQVAEIPEVMVFSHLRVSQPQHSQVPDLKKRTNTTCFFSTNTSAFAKKHQKATSVILLVRP